MRVEADRGLSRLRPLAPAWSAAAEHVPLDPESIDLAVSLLSLQTTNDIPGMLIQIRRALRPDGLFLGVLAGVGTLSELRESLLAAETELYGGASPRVAPFTDVREAGALLQRAGFALPVADVETVTVRYDTLFDLMADLRAMGATNALLARSRRPGVAQASSPAPPKSMPSVSPTRTVAIRATFSFVWMSGWAPDASQQKPLKPGSAQVSLARLLEGSKDYLNRRAGRSGQGSLVDSLLQPAVVVAPQIIRARSRRVPTPPTMASDRTATMRPYSIAVAPVSSFKKHRIIGRMAPPSLGMDLNADLLRKVNATVLTGGETLRAFSNRRCACRWRG